MQRYALALFVICVVAVYAILELRPDPAVELEAELSRMAPEQALARLDALDSDTVFTENLRLMHARLAAAAGDLATAEAAYRDVVEAGGPTSEVLDELAHVAALAGDLAGAAVSKARAEALNPDDERRQTLGYWYRLLGDDAGEVSLLSATEPRRLTAFERERLAALHLAAGNVEAYRDMLAAMSDSGGDDALTARRQLLELSIEAGDPDAALTQALDWSAAAPEDRDGLEASLKTLVGRGALDQAVALATRSIEANPEIGSVPVMVFIGTGHGGIGRRIQALWLAADAGLDDEDWQALIRVAEQSGDLAALRLALARGEARPGAAGGETDDAQPPADAFLQFLRYQGVRALLPYRGAMTREIFEDGPLIGAAWHGWHRQPEETYGYLLAAAEGPLTDWDRAIWMSVADDLRGTPLYRELLAGAPEDAGLRDLLGRGVRSPVPMNSPAGKSAATGD